VQNCNTIFIEGLTVVGKHGVNAHERDEGRLFQIDLEAHVAALPGFTTDRLHDTLDYQRLAQIIVDVASGTPLNLVEHLAERIAQRCLALPEVHSLRLRVRKKATGVVGNPDWVGVEIFRQGAGLSA